MHFEKKQLVLAVASVITTAVYAVPTSAEVTIPGTSPVTYAEEIVLPSSGAVLTNAGASSSSPGILDINATLNYAMSPGEVRYARLECGSSSVFNFPATVTVSVGATSITPGAVNGLGTNGMYFSLTASTSGGAPASASVLVKMGDPKLLTETNVSCTFSLYDQPSNAATGGATGRIPGVGGTGPYIAFTPAFFLEVYDSNTTTADVAAPNGAFTAFLDGVGPPPSTAAQIGILKSGIHANVLKLNGEQANFNELLAAGTNLVVTGNYGAVGASGVQLWTSLGGPIGCYDGSGTPTNGTLDAGNTTATFAYPSPSAPSGPFTAYSTLCYDVDGVTPIAASLYDGDFNPVSNTGYSVSSTIANGPTIGEIIRNGTELRAPLVQRPGGWTGRVVLFNVGNADRDYTINIVDEEGNPAVDGTLTGTILKNSIKVLDINTIIAGFATNPPARAGLQVFVGAPSNEIEGLFQLINTTTGSPTNYVMVRPTTTTSGKRRPK